MVTAMRNEEITEKKSGKKLSPVDIIMIIVTGAGIIAAIVFAVILLTNGNGGNGSDKNAKKPGDFEYEILVSRLDTGMFEVVKGADNELGAVFLQAGDDVYDRLSGSRIGTVKSVSYRSSMVPTGDVTATGELEYAEYPGFIDVIIRVEAYSDGKDGTFTMNSYDIRAGRKIAFRTYGYFADGEIISVSRPDGE